MLLDEPFASLDPNLRTQLRADIVDILRTPHAGAVRHPRPDRGADDR